MSLNQAFHYSKNALLIDLDQAHIEEIVDQKLLYSLNQKPLEGYILKRFYSPVEQALLEFCLEKQKGNQLKTAQVLGINRNTLKTKITAYNLNIKKLLIENKKPYPQSRIFLSSMDSLNLLSVCRAKLTFRFFQNSLPNNNILKIVCQPVEKIIIQRVLSHCKGNKIRSAHLLGINRNTLKKKITSKNKFRAG